MKLSKYSASGNTQSNGIEVISWQNRFVVASRSADAQAASVNHKTSTAGVVCSGGTEVSAESTTSSFAHCRVCQAHQAQSTVYVPNKAAQILPCHVMRRVGSIRKGNANSPSNEPRFETEYSRYVLASPLRRANHRCSNGPVVDSTKNGSPAATTRITTTSRTGAVLLIGFHPGPGVMADGHTSDSPATNTNPATSSIRCKLH